MISQMDQIFDQAAFTIIAAADGDTDMGLCGISMPREPQAHVKIGDVALVEVPTPFRDLKFSAWSKRGWTYQEGYISRRRLIFTKSQVLFLCNAMYATESMQSLLNDTCYSSDTSRFEYFIPRFRSEPRNLTPIDLLVQMEVYSRRDLSRAGDTLNAFLGVLDYYARKTASSEKPIIPLPWGLITKRNTNERSLSLHILWFHDEIAPRLPLLPSWSWAGWGGSVHFIPDEVVLRPPNPVGGALPSYIDWKVSIRDAGGTTQDVYDLAWRLSETPTSLRPPYRPGPQLLQISCLIVPFAIQELDLTKRERYRLTEISVHDTGEVLKCDRDLAKGPYPTLNIWKGVCFTRKEFRDLLRLDQKTTQQDTVVCLVCQTRGPHSPVPKYYCILAREVAGDLYERVGILPLGYVTNLEVHHGIYFDEMGNVLDRIVLSSWQVKYPFSESGVRKTVCLI
jgi:hypothetical protein